MHSAELLHIATHVNILFRNIEITYVFRRKHVKRAAIYSQRKKISFREIHT